MSFVPARSNEYTATYRQWSDPFVTTTTRFYNDGRVTSSQSAFNQYVHRVFRWSHSNNKQGVVAGTSTSWRPASNYMRAVMDFSWNSGAWQSDTPNPAPGTVQKTIIEGAPNALGGTTCFDLPPVFQAGGVAQDNNQLNQAVTECLLKLADGKAQLGAALGEARQTADMLASGFHSLLSAYRDVKHGRLGRVLSQVPTSKRMAKDLAQLRLELVYGWLPLMSDIKGTYDVLTEKLKPAMLIHAKRRVSDSSVSNYSGTAGWESTGKAKRSHSCELIAMPNLGPARTASRLGLVNPLSVAWELVPFSFVVDWGLPVGNVLSALTATTGLTFVGGFKAVHADGKINARLKPTGNYVEQSPRSGDLDFSYYRRYGLTGFPTPLPYAVNPFSTGHILNAVALWTQRNLW